MRKVLFIVLQLIVTFLIFPNTTKADMKSYCSIPPFAYVSVPPNVLIILDNSGSMYEFAYKDSYDPNRRYYGYFDPDKKYAYAYKRNWRDGYFYESSSGSWSGNFLNWLTMRRIDVAKKVLVGGDYTSYGSGYMLNLIDDPDRDLSRSWGRYRYYFYPSNLWRSIYSMEVYDTASHTSRFYRLRVLVNKKPEGVIQKTWTKVRYGVMVFNEYGNRYEDGYWGRDGGRIVYYISGPGEDDKLIKVIQSVRPRTWTPLAETYYEAIRYFEAEVSAYNREDYSDNDPIQYRCQKNFVILITDGESTKDMNLPGTCFGRGTVRDSKFNIKEWMDKIASNEGYSSQYCRRANRGDGTYYLEGVAYYSHVSDLRDDFKGMQNLTLYDVFVFDESPVGRELLQKAAKYGGFDDFNGNSIPDERAEWDKNGDGIPDNYYEAQDGYKIEQAIEEVIEEIIKRASGTSASILPEKAKRGTVLYQSVFYHKKNFGVHNLKWIGYLYTWWFLNTKKSQNVREDTKADKVLEILEDRILDWYLDEDTGTLIIKAYSSKPSGEPDTLVASYSSFDDTTPLWEGGEILAFTSADSRVIFTTDGERLIPFNRAHEYEFSSYLGSTYNFPSCLRESVESLIEYVRGKHIDGCRDRRFDDSGNVWKLGDIVYSSPTVVHYENYDVVFVGANDGMLHAFKVGYVKKLANSATPLRLQDSSTETTYDTLGHELWAFIPKSVLPYLRYLADPDYCHIYYVDLRPFSYKLDENGDGVSDRVILIGGMRLGGGVDCSTSGCSMDNCVSPPNDSSGIGYSSYFALDVTDPENPKLLWEFTDSNLGFTYSGPGIVKKGSNYYLVFASGPTTYKGDSCKELRFFVVNLLTGKLEAEIPSGEYGSFGGRLFKEGYDFNGDGDTDYLFIGFSRNFSGSWVGGLAVLDTRDSVPSNWTVTIIDSVKDVSKNAYFILGPITAKVVVNECFEKPYLYFGTGKWFYKTEESSGIERFFGLPLNCNAAGCTVVTDVVNATNSSNSNDVCTELNSGNRVGWYVNLNTGDVGYLAERVITDPTETNLNVVMFTTIEPTSDVCGFGGRSRMWLLNCATGGSVTQECKNFKVDSFIGTVLLQLSGANIQEISIRWTGNPSSSNVSSILSEEGARATAWFTGIAPETAPPFIKPGKGLSGKLLLWLER